jgi:hypothetical protein
MQIVTGIAKPTTEAQRHGGELRIARVEKAEPHRGDAEALNTETHRDPNIGTRPQTMHFRAPELYDTMASFARKEY